MKREGYNAKNITFSFSFSFAENQKRRNPWQNLKVSFRKN